MNIRVADIQACYELWKSRGAEFITEPIPKYGETRCYIRDPDGYIIEVGQSTDAQVRLNARLGSESGLNAHGQHCGLKENNTAAFKNFQRAVNSPRG